MPFSLISSKVSLEGYMEQCVKELLNGEKIEDILDCYHLQKYELLTKIREELWNIKHLNNEETLNKLSTTFYQECFLLRISKKPVALFSDTHFGSKDEKLEYYQMFIDFCLTNHIYTLLHGGDIGDGLVRCSTKYRNSLKQLDHILEVYIDSPFLKQYILGGNHDEKYHHHGIDILKELAMNKRNITPLGYGQCFIQIFNNIVSIEHHARLSKEEKILPYDFTIAGHSHKSRFTNHSVRIPTLSNSIQYPNIIEGLPGFIIMIPIKKENKLCFERYYFINGKIKKEEKTYIYQLQKRSPHSVW